MNNHEAVFNTASDLVYLVSCSVNGTKPDGQKVLGMNLPEIYRLAKAHSLVTASALAVEQVMPLPEYYLEAKAKAVKKLALYDIERKTVLSAYEQNKIWYLPLKGSVLKTLYPKNIMREMTDVDILCDSSRMDDVLKIMEAHGYSCKKFGQDNHDVYDKPPVMEFEIHRQLFDKRKQPLIAGYFAEIKSRLTQTEGTSYGYSMTREDFYIYILCHLYKHYRLGGTGLRSLLDIYLYNKRYGSLLDRGYLETELKKLKLNGFEEEISLLAYKVFTLSQLNSSEKKELIFFIKSGGNGSKENLLIKYLENDDSKSNKRKYIIGRIFPDDASLREYNPFVYRHKALYPAFIVYRSAKGLITHPKKLLGEYRKIKSFKSTEYRGKYNE